MECKKCKKECLETELKDGFCDDCYKKYNGNIIKLKTSKNAVAQYLKNWAIASIIVGALLGIIDFVANGSFLLLICIILGFLVTAGLLRACSEIIQLLEDIKNK